MIRLTELGFGVERTHMMMSNTWGVMRWQPLVWGGRVMVFWAHLGPESAMELGSVVGAVTKEELMRTGEESERGFAAERKESEVCICGPKVFKKQGKPKCTKLGNCCGEFWVYKTKMHFHLILPLPHV